MKTKAEVAESKKSNSKKPTALEGPVEAGIKLTRLLVSRKTWARGKRSYLLQEDGKMCILGQYLNTIGVPRDALMEQGSPFYVARVSEAAGAIISNKAPWLLKGELDNDTCADSFAACKATYTNDIANIKDLQREEQLKEIFWLHKIDLEFVD